MSLRTWPLQNCEGIRYLEILFVIVFTKFMAYFGEEISIFCYVGGVSIKREFKFIQEFFNWSANESITFS